jgi:sterol carrier protein 2
MGLEAATKALLDAGELPLAVLICGSRGYLLGYTGITYDDVETAFVGYCYGDSTSGQVGNARLCHRRLLTPLSAACSL